MADKKERIMDLMRKGIITQDEALELLEGAGSDLGDFEEKVQADNNKNATNDDDSQAYENHKVDFGQSLKNTFGQVADTVTEAFKGFSKTVDDNVDFSKGWPKVKTQSKTVEFDIPDYFESVYFDAKAGKVSINPGENAHVKLDYKVYGAVESIDGYLAEHAKSQVEDGTFVVEATGRLSVEMALYLPERDYQRFELKLLNGRISLGNQKAKELLVSSKNGDFTIENSQVDNLVLDLINGEVKYDGSFVDANISLGNGNVRITQKDMRAKKLSVKNINGDIKLSVPEPIALTGHVKTIFGSYKTRLRLDAEQNFESGKNGATVVRSGEEGLTFDLEVKSGTIWLKDA